jgi:hypothetical protein
MKKYTDEEKKVLRVHLVLTRLADLVKNPKDDMAQAIAGDLIDPLEEMIQAIHSDDGFGTEGECDPRGDFRDGSWNMWNHIQGVDDAR